MLIALRPLFFLSLLPFIWSQIVFRYCDSSSSVAVACCTGDRSQVSLWLNLPFVSIIDFRLEPFPSMQSLCDSLRICITLFCDR